MKQFFTTFTTLSPTGDLLTFQGDLIPAPTFQMAEQYCRVHKPHLTVVGEMISEIPTLGNSLIPDWDRKIDFDIDQN